MNIPKERLDDLTVIDGIGHTRQDWLRKKMGIRTYQDLGDLEPQNIVSLLKADGQIVSLKIVQVWCEAARNLAANDPPADPSDWNPLASFVVEFQVRQAKGRIEEYCTAVQHMESETEHKWTGVESAQLCQWMREWVAKAAPEAVALPATPTPEAAPVAEGAPADPTLTAQVAPVIKIGKISLYQPQNNLEAAAWCTAGGIFVGDLKSEQPCAARVSLLINSCDLSELQQRGLKCELQLFSRQVPGGRILPLGKPVQIPLQGGKNDYEASIAALSLPAGTHHLKMRAKIMLAPPVLSHLEAQYLKVI